MPPVTEDGVSTYFLAINRNKRSVALDLKDDGDRALAQELARRADVLVQNFKPGGLARFGLDYDAVSAGEPVGHLRLDQRVRRGGGKDLPGYDLMVQAMSGLMSLTGDPDGPPYRAGISVVRRDRRAAHDDRHPRRARPPERDRRGPAPGASLMASAMSGMVNQTSAYAAGGVVPYRMGNSHPSLFPYEPLPTGDGELIVTAGNDAQFRKLCEVIGAPELADDPRFSTQPRPHRQPGHAAGRCSRSKLAAKSAGEWFDALIAVGVPCGPINTVDKGIAFAEKIGLEPIVTAGSGRRTRPTMRHPVDLLQDARELPARPARARRAGRGDP